MSTHIFLGLVLLSVAMPVAAQESSASQISASCKESILSAFRTHLGQAQPFVCGDPASCQGAKFVQWRRVTPEGAPLGRIVVKIPSLRMDALLFYDAEVTDAENCVFNLINW